MANQQNEQGIGWRKPPYTAIAVMDGFFDKIKKINPPTDPITINTFKSWAIAENQEHSLLSALKFLGAIDSEGKPTEDFAKLQLTGESLHRELKRIIEAAYTEFFKVYNYESLGSLSRDEIIAFFQQHSNASKKKMATVFGYLCDLAGMPNQAFSKRGKIRPTERTGVITQKQRLPKKQKVIKQPQPTRTEDSEILRLAEAMKDWDAEKMKMFFNGIRETHGKKTEKQESDE